MKKNTVLYIVLVLLAVLALTSIAADDSGRKFTTILTGAAEVPGPGDPDGTGIATITLNHGQGQVCWEIRVSNIALPATLAHIHVIDPATGFGPPVVTLTPPDATGFSSGCITAGRDLIKNIIQNPEQYYVNVHTSDFGPGAVRGDLSK